MNTNDRTELDCAVSPVIFSRVYTRAEDMPNLPSTFGRRRFVAAGAVAAALMGIAAFSSFMPSPERVQFTSQPANVTLDAK